MEDVDAAGKVVHRRNPAAQQTRTVTRTIVRNPTATSTLAISRQATAALEGDHARPAPLLLPSRGRSATVTPPPTPKAAAAKLPPTSEERGGKVALAGDVSPAAAAVAAATAEAVAAAEEEQAVEEILHEEIVTVDASTVLSKDRMKSMFEDEDKLDLAGLLNVLDGVVDSPNRIVIMTTNHPEKLDPALVRPGRINKKMLLGYLYLPEAEKMVEHYFGPMSVRQRERMGGLFTPNVFTPAQVEQLCAEYDTVDDFLIGLHTLKAQEY